MEQKRKTIFLVDDNPTNLLIGKNALVENYNVFTIPSGEKMFEMLKKITPDLILLDVSMPGMSGYDAIKSLKADPSYSSIPVIFLTALYDSANELEGLSLGAIDYISKPFSPALLLKRIGLHILVEDQKSELREYNQNLEGMVSEKTREVFELQNAVLKTVAELVECRDDTTGGHIERTKGYLRALIDAMLERGMYSDEIAGWDIDLCLESSQLHDVGKIKIEDSILKKPGKLTTDEFTHMKEHTTYGVEIIETIQNMVSEQVQFLQDAKTFASSHHEKWDGSGYPFGLERDGIPLKGRMMAIADVYDALISERPYKKPFSHEKAKEIILEGRGAHFDPELVDLFCEISDKFKEISLRFKD